MSDLVDNYLSEVEPLVDIENLPESKRLEAIAAANAAILREDYADELGYLEALDKRIKQELVYIASRS